MPEIRGYIRERNGRLEAVFIRPDGTKSTRVTGCAPGQEAEAEEVLRLALAELNSAPAAPAPAGPLTVEAWGEKWIEDRKARGKLEWIYERGHLQHYLYPVLGSLPLDQANDVRLLDWARGLERMKGPTGKHPGPKYVRRITATVRALFKEAVKRHLVERTPCIWDNSDLPEMEANSRVTGEGFDVRDVARLIGHPKVPEDRRVLYAMEFLTGMRTGEAAARVWRDWDPEFLGQLGRLTVATAYNTRFRVLKSTKTRVEKWIPVHPALAAILEAWRREGFERFYGWKPGPDDLIVPATRGGPRNASHSWRCFQNDCGAAGVAKQRHYDTRSAFISIAEGAGADPAQVARITHASLNGAKDLYRRVRRYWPLMCEAVRCIKLPALEPREVAGGVADEASKVDGSDENSSHAVVLRNTGNGGRARESKASAEPPDSPVSGGVLPASPGSPAPSAPGSLPDAGAAFAQACATAAAAALEAGDVPRARNLLEKALQALGKPPTVRLVGP